MPLHSRPARIVRHRQKPDMKMNFWQRHKRQRGAIRALPGNRIAPKPFEPLSREQSLAVLLEASYWLRAQEAAVLLMPDGPAKRRREAELLARDRCVERDYQALQR